MSMQNQPVHGPLTIIDVGAHHGDDSAYYLAKGFNVVGIEANPTIAKGLRDKFAGPISEGRYELIEAAVASEPGEIEFFMNLDKDDWSSTDATFGTRHGTRYTKIKVPAVTFDSILAQYPKTYYVKCDIEGGDIEVLKAMHKTRQRPKFISFEANSTEYLSHMVVLGYKKFKLVNQNLNWAQKTPNPPLEGRYVEHTFPGDSSGPFGEEAPGTWMTCDETAEMYLALKRVVERQPTISNAWYDFHAKWE
jgi:FkbM family methyltransferase